MSREAIFLDTCEAIIQSQKDETPEEMTVGNNPALCVCGSEGCEEILTRLFAI